MARELRMANPIDRPSLTAGRRQSEGALVATAATRGFDLALFFVFLLPNTDHE
jgi:hypothetical protein